MLQELAELSEVQLRQCESARRHSKAQQKRLDASNKRLQEGLSVLIDLPQEHGTEKAILNISEPFPVLLAPSYLSCFKCAL